MNFYYAEAVPQKCYLMSKNQVIEADNEMGGILEKIKSLYVNKHGHTIQIQGVEYEIGDFVVRWGSVSQGNNTSKGTIVEVEYKPSLLPNEGAMMLQEFVANIVSEKTPLGLDFTPKLNLPELYSNQHTTYQYVSVFKTLGLLYNNKKKAEKEAHPKLGPQLR
eukprot:TRINITY_DN970_c0_g1_i1.p2 TRINITY_DN970_c0_g1~~TRINITY_DN970_c0_g1_i1.p2  ORF type:complete len:163 (-),score=37.70 TRINITY_DN970_c0_g1_i1:58-546(-)